ncbi:hypothetical protein EAO76_21250 [Streptomyces sp. sk2.1]|nr:hypothetical protein EAO76_21250 [Streptomyces sp. sk2.1]
MQAADAQRTVGREARRTFSRHLAGRRVVDVTGPEGPGLAAIGDGHRRGGGRGARRRSEGDAGGMIPPSPGKGVRAEAVGPCATAARNIGARAPLSSWMASSWRRAGRRLLPGRGRPACPAVVRCASVTTLLRTPLVFPPAFHKGVPPNL